MTLDGYSTGPTKTYSTSAVGLFYVPAHDNVNEGERH